MGWAYLTQEEAQRTIEPNTLTLPRSHNSATADVETEPKLIKHRVGEMSANYDVVGTWRTRT
jgi:hypothetical protein